MSLSRHSELLSAIQALGARMDARLDALSGRIDALSSGIDTLVDAIADVRADLAGHSHDE